MRDPGGADVRCEIVLLASVNYASGISDPWFSMLPYLPIHHVPFTTNTFSGLVFHSSPMSFPKSKSPFGWNPKRLCCHTKNSAEPGRYSQRTTALPRSER